jgi:alpha-beta hydrolase superfamily lysophospholipase
MFSRIRNRAVRLALRVAFWIASVLAAAVVGFSAYAILALAPLQPWHRLTLTQEFDARRHASLDFAGLLALEKRLFDELRGSAILVRGEADALSRYAPDGWGAHLAGRGDGPVQVAPYNRSFELAPGERRGSALLIHGLTDSPYSVLALARRLHARGLHVVVVRLPGHGTVPAGQLSMTYEDWSAAVRIAARHAAALAGPGQPFYVGGYSTGGTLALTYALDSLGDRTLRQPTRVLLVSPAIELPRGADLTRILDALAFLPGLEPARWQDVRPEYDPYKYNSFAVNASRQVLAATNALTAATERARKAGAIDRLAPVIAFQSVVDSTVGAKGVFESTFGGLSGERHELVLFDVNRRDVLRALHPPAVAAMPKLLTDLRRPHTLTVVTNRDGSSDEVVLRRRKPGGDVVESATAHAWPRNIVSVGHVALCFPPDDEIYGFAPVGGPNAMPTLGSLLLRGEAGALSLPLSTFTRLRSNPFFALIAARIDELLDADLTK